MFIAFIERSKEMICAVMFLLGFVLTLLAMYARISLLIYLSATLMIFSWTGKEGLHRAFRLIPIALCLLVCGIAINRTMIYGTNYYYYDFIIAISAMASMFLFVTMLPDSHRTKRC